VALNVLGEHHSFDAIYKGLGGELVLSTETDARLLDGRGVDMTRVVRFISLLTTRDLSRYSEEVAFLIKRAVFDIMEDSRVVVLPVLNDAPVSKDVFSSASHLAFYLNQREEFSEKIVIPIFKPFAQKWMWKGTTFDLGNVKAGIPLASPSVPVSIMNTTFTFSHSAWTPGPATSGALSTMNHFKITIEEFMGAKSKRFVPETRLKMVLAYAFMDAFTGSLSLKTIHLCMLYLWLDHDVVPLKGRYKHLVKGTWPFKLENPREFDGIECVEFDHELNADHIQVRVVPESHRQTLAIALKEGIVEHIMRKL
jgi:hypothetical protein